MMAVQDIHVFILYAYGFSCLHSLCLSFSSCYVIYSNDDLMLLLLVLAVSFLFCGDVRIVTIIITVDNN